MASLGERLRRQRERKGISLADIAAETRISRRYLEALERDDIRTLPGTLFAKSFARQYASLVGLSEEEIEDELRDLVHPEEVVALPGQEPPAVLQVEPIPDAVGVVRVKHRRFAMALASLVAVASFCSAVYVYWQKRVERSAEERIVSRQPAQLPAGETPGSASSTAQALSSGAGEGTTISATEGSLTVTGNGMRIEIVAKEATWISIRTDGRSIFSGILQPNETKHVAGIERASLVVGNAGGVEISTNGRSLGPIGPRGQVRLVTVGPEGAEIIRRQRPAAGAGASPEDAPMSPRS